MVTKEKFVPTDEQFLETIAQALHPLQIGQLISIEGRTVHHVRDWSYMNQHICGENWLAIGDAAAFIDPILSGGVDFAIRSALKGAMALILKEKGEVSALQDFESNTRSEIGAYLRMARYWYGNNRSMQGFFWEAMAQMPKGTASTSLRAFVYLTSGQYATDSHFKVFSQWQEKQMFKALGFNKRTLRDALIKKVEP